MTASPLPPGSRWVFADSEIRLARLEGSHLHMHLSAAHVVLTDEDGREAWGHVTGLSLRAEHAHTPMGEPWPVWGDVLGRITEGRWQGAGPWQREWPLDASPPPGPLRLQWQLPHRIELDLRCNRLVVLGLQGATFHRSLAC